MGKECVFVCERERQRERHVDDGQKKKRVEWKRGVAREEERERERGGGGEIGKLLRYRDRETEKGENRQKDR